MYQNDHAWFAVQVRPRHELTTAKILRNKGLEEFVPLYTSKRQWSDRKKEVVLPLFTGYIFCKFAPKTKLPVATTPGVIRIVGAKAPCPIAEHEIESIRRASLSPERVRPYPYDPYVAIGSKVRIEDGPFAGIEGVLINQVKHSQFILSVGLVQRSIVVDINDCTVVPVIDQGKSENIIMQCRQGRTNCQLSHGPRNLNETAPRKDVLIPEEPAQIVQKHIAS
jgi:transcription antitermination factor NusG